LLKIVAELHTHTVTSGHGLDTVRTICEYAIKKSLEGVAITDHRSGLIGVWKKFTFYP